MAFSRYLLIPDIICDSVFDIPQKYLKRKKIKLIIFDIDNTLVPYGVEKPSEELLDFFRELTEKDIKIAFVSNNSEERVQKFNEELGFFAMPNAQKPKKKSLFPALEKYSDIKKKNILFVGDQLLTDVLTARKNGIHVVKVKPIEKRESLFFKIKRSIEVPFIKEYYRNQERKKQKRQKRKNKNDFA